MNVDNPGAVTAPANVLFVHRGRGTLPGCDERWHGTRPIAEIRVSYAGSAAHFQPRARSNGGPDKVGIISVGDVLRGADVDTAPDDDASVAVEAVNDPTNLSTLGVHISEFCERWGDDHHLRCRFESLDVLLRYAAPETVFQFCYVLTKRFTDVGAIAHFHFDPDGHEDRVTATFGAIFDEVIVTEAINADREEATDDDVAAVLCEFDGGGPHEWANELPTVSQEATDDDLARLFGE